MRKTHHFLGSHTGGLDCSRTVLIDIEDNGAHAAFAGTAAVARA
jgi:hypothetical protein